MRGPRGSLVTETGVGVGGAGAGAGATTGVGAGVGMRCGGRGGGWTRVNLTPGG